MSQKTNKTNPDTLYLTRRKPMPSNSSMVVRIDGETYGRLLIISGETGLTIPKLIGQLVDFAAARVEYVDEE